MVPIKPNQPLAPHTIFKIGGPAKYFAEAARRSELTELLTWARQKALPIFILGGGSNVLIADGGFVGLVIKVTGLRGLEIDSDGRLTAEAGVSMSRLVAFALDNGLVGIEWAVGIPGTLGGSICGNAGCFGGEIKDVLDRAEVFDCSSGDLKVFDNATCRFGYRDSAFKRNPDWIILGAALKLPSGNTADSRKLIRQYSVKRSISQDIGAQCAGCVFKNVAWSEIAADRDTLSERFPELLQFARATYIPAGFLLDKCGLKGARTGGASISARHANYFVNGGTATAEEMSRLIESARKSVSEKYGIMLQEEIQRIGF